MRIHPIRVHSLANAREIPAAAAAFQGPRASVRSHSLAIGAALALSACGGGMPLLHPAQPLPAGVTSISGGVGSHWIGGQARRELDTAQAQWASQGPNSLPPAAAIAAAAWAPGLFPWVSMRMGLGARSEAGVAYTGQRARLDARRAVGMGNWAVSFGLGATMGLSHPADASASGTNAFRSTELLPGLDSSGARSFGIDAPFIVGWRSSADVARIWLGLRPAYEHGYGSLLLTREEAATKLDFRSDAFTVTALAGFAVGLRPFFVALELGVGDTRAKGKLLNVPNPTPNSAAVAAYSFTPAAALIWEMH